jgi:putative DNA methylase
LLDDATSLGKLADEKFDLIVTDPPYRDDVAYAELSDFYYVWLKRALSDVADVMGLRVRVPRFLREAFFDEYGVEIETQWRMFASREISESEGRASYFGVRDALDHFKHLLSESFRSMSSRLKDDGVLVTYYAHTTPEAWEALLEAGWMAGRLRITAAHALITESLERVTARGKSSLDMSIVAVWRKGVSGARLADEVYREAVDRCYPHAWELIYGGFRGVDLLVSVLGCVLSVFTKYERIVGAGSKGVRDLVEKYIYPASAESIAWAFRKPEAGGGAVQQLGSVSLFYILSKILVEVGRRGRRVLDRSTLNLLSIATRNNDRDLISIGIVTKAADSYQLMEPERGRDTLESIRDLLRDRGLDPRASRPRNAVDALHMLEYYSASLPRDDFIKMAEEMRSKNPALYSEAIEMAKILDRVLESIDPGDVERNLVAGVLKSLGLKAEGLERWGRSVLS